MKNIQSFVRKHPLCKNALWLLLFVPLFFLSQFPLITMVYSLQEGMDARWVTILTLLVTVAVLFIFYIVIKKSPLENLDAGVITWPSLGRNFLFLLLLMANNLLAYPLLKQEAGGTTANQAALNELQSHAPFLAMGMVVILVAPILEELLCRAIIPRLIFRGAEPIGYLAGALFFTYLHGPSTLGGMGSLRRYVFDLNLGGLSLPADRVQYLPPYDLECASLLLSCCIPPLFIAGIESFLP